MAVKIRLTRIGSKKNPCYRIVAADARAPRDGRCIEQLGTYTPLLAKESPDRFKFDADRVKYWIGVGAEPTEVIKKHLKKAGVL